MKACKRLALAAFTAPFGTRPCTMSLTWRTVSIA